MTSDAHQPSRIARLISRREAVALLALGVGPMSVDRVLADAAASGARRRPSPTRSHAETDATPAPAGAPLEPPLDRTPMTIACFIRYQIDPFQREAFARYAAAWRDIIPRCGGHLIGYFLPCEGTNDVGWGLIAVDSLAGYERYRARLKADPDARANFGAAQRARCILREERTFVELVDETFDLPAAGHG